MVRQSRARQQKKDSTIPTLEEQREEVVLLGPGFPKKADPWQDCLADNGAMEQTQSLLEISTGTERVGAV